MGQTNDYKTGISCFSAIKQAVLRSKSKDWLDQNPDVSEWSLPVDCCFISKSN